MKKKLLIERHFMQRFCLLLLIGVYFMSCESDTKSKPDYDPNQPIELTRFYPDSGIFLEKVMLEGKNFGTDPDKIRVWFNNRRAAVVGSTGQRMYVLAPRLPGDECIISVAVGSDSVVYGDIFKYKTSVTVTTIAGNGQTNAYQDGALSSSVLRPRYLCVDKEDNIFVINWSDGYHVARIDEENNELITIARDVIGNAPAADPETGVISFPTETTVGSFYTLSPSELWAPRIREMKWPAEGDRPPNGWKHSMVVNPHDGFIYVRYNSGHLVKIHPTTYEVETIYKTAAGDTYGLTFNPLTPNILYMSFFASNAISSIDVTDPENTFKNLTGTMAGHRDGPLATAQFRNPSQIFCDADGNMYIADSGNHCIRRITPEGMVETVLGMPGTPGWKDGGREEALFNQPRGVGISKDGSVYVADFGNARVRKLSIN